MTAWISPILYSLAFCNVLALILWSGPRLKHALATPGSPVLREALLLAGAMVMGILAYLSVPPTSLAGALDPSWQMVLEHATAKRLAYGRDIIFTFGPLSPASSEWYFGKGIFNDVRVAFCIWQATLTALLWARLSSTISGWLGALLWLWLLFFPGEADTYALLALIVWHLGLKDTSSAADRLISLLILPASLATLGLVKFTYSLVSIFCLSVSMAGAFIARDRWRPVVQFLVFGMVLVGVWLATGQSLSILPLWIQRSLEVSSAYADTLQAWTVTPLALWISAGALVASAMAMLGAAYRMLRRSDWHGVFVCIALLGFLGIVWKHSVIRADGHLALLHSMSPILCCLAYALVQRARITPAEPFPAVRSTWPVAVVALFAVLVALWGRKEVHQQTIPELATSFTRHGLHHWDTLADDVGTKTDFPPETVLPEIKKQLRGQPVDVFNFLQSVAFANDLNYHPRPAFQSYQACSPPLMEANRAYWASKPELHLICRMEAIDGRFTASEDAACWPLWLRTMAPIMTEKDFILLSPKGSPAIAQTWSPAGSAEVSFKEPVPVPAINADQLLRLKIDAPRSLRGRLVKAAFQPESLQLRTTFADGSFEVRRISTGAAVDGFLVKPYLETNVDLLAYYADDKVMQRQPVSVQIQAESGREREFAKTIRVQWETLPLVRDRDEAFLAKQQELLRESRIPFPGRAPEILGADLPGEVVQLSLKMLSEVRVDGVASLRVDAPSRIAMQNDKRGGKLEIAYVIPEASWKRKTPTDGVRFVISTFDSQGQENVLLDHYLDPAKSEADRLVHKKTFQVPPNEHDWLILRTECGATDKQDRAIWSGFKWTPAAPRR